MAMSLFKEKREVVGANHAHARLLILGPKWGPFSEIVSAKLDDVNN